MLALPDFAAGAMENLGCITYRENLLLVDPATSTQAEQQNIADVVTHELAHMWFGDLVTMRWWNGIWLNEAFATFMELAACDAYRPDWERWTPFSLERTAAFETDSLASTRPVEYEVRSPQDCDGMFDVLTYQKGGALLRMLEQYLGEDRFRNGVSHYLRSHAYAQHRDQRPVGRHRGDHAATPVRRLMDSWIWQPGYPLVSASLDGGRARAAPAALRLRRRHAGGRRVADHVAGAGARAHRRRRRRRSCSTAPRPAPSLSDPTAPSSSTPGATASSASPTTTSCAAGSSARCSAIARHARALQPRRRRLERGRRRAPARRRLPRLRRGLRRRARAGRVAGDRHRPARPRPAGRRRRPAGAAGARPHAARSGRRRARRPVDGRGRPAGQAARPARPLRWPSRVPTTPPRRGLPRRIDGTRTRRAPSIPSWSPRPRRSSPPAADESTFERLRRRVPQRRHAAGPAALPVRPGRVRQRGAASCGRASSP